MARQLMHVELLSPVSAVWMHQGVPMSWTLFARTQGRERAAGVKVTVHLIADHKPISQISIETDDKGFAEAVFDPPPVSVLAGDLVLQAELRTDGSPLEVPVFPDFFTPPDGFTFEIPSSVGEPVPSSGIGSPIAPPFGAIEFPTPSVSPPEVPPSVFGEELGGPVPISAPGVGCPPPELGDVLDTLTDETSAVFADPVFVHNGEFVRSERVLYLASPGFPMTFVLTWRSRVLGGSAAGRGCDFNWNRHIRSVLGGLQFCNGYGRVDLFSADPQTPGRFLPPPGFYADLREQTPGPDGVRYKLTWENESVLLFDVAGRITTQRDRFGNEQRFTYNAAGQLESVTGTRGQTVRLSYDDAGFLSTLTDPTGRQIAFKRAITPTGTGAIGEISSWDSKRRNFRRTRYEYDSKHVLSRIYEPGNRVSPAISNVYDSERRVIEQVHEERTHRIEYIDANTTRVEDAFGTISEFSFNGAVTTRVAIRKRDGTIAEIRHEHGDIANGFFETTRLVHPHGNATVFNYDRSAADPRLRRRLVEIRREPPTGSLDPVRRVRLEWDPDRALVTAVIPPQGLEPGADPNDWATRYVYDAKGQMVECRPPPASLYDSNGNRTGAHQAFVQNTYDARGLLVRTTNATGVGTSIGYDSLGPDAGLPRAIVKDDTGERATTKLDYDLLGRITGAVLPDGRRLEAVYDDFNRAVRLRRGGRDLLRYSFDTDGQHRVTATRILLPDNSGERLAPPDTWVEDPSMPWVRQQFTYDQFGYVTRIEDEIEPGVFAVTRYEFDRGRLVRQIAPGGEVAKYGHDEFGHVNQVVIAAGLPEQSVHRYGYDDNGNEISYTDPEGHSVHSVYDGFDSRIEMTDPLGNRVEWQRDLLGRIVLVTQYDAGGTAVGRRRLTWDAMGRSHWCDRIELDDAGAETGQFIRTAQVYDPISGLVREAHRIGAGPGAPKERFSIEYDRRSRMIRQEDALGNAILYDYDSNGRLDRVCELSAGATSPSYSTRFEYDNEGRLVAEISESDDGSLVTALRRNYDSRGLVTFEENENGETTRFVHDGRGLISLREQHVRRGGAVVERLTTRFLYDLNGNIREMIDANGESTRHRMDGHGRVVRVEHPGGGAIEYRYDGDSKRVWSRDASGTEVRYGYNGADQLISKRIIQGADVEGISEVDLEWDGLDRLVRMRNEQSDVLFTYDSLGNMVAASQNGLKVGRIHDGLGRRVALTTPGGRLDYAKDVLGRIENCTDDASGDLLFDYAYRGRRLTTRRNHSNGVDDRFDYDRMDRLVFIESTGTGGQRLAAHGFDLDGFGLRTRISHEGGPAFDEHLAYDSVGQLVGVDRRGLVSALPPGLAQELRYSHDPAGNRSSVITDGQMTAYRIGPGNRYVQVGATHLDYDIRGDLRSDGRRRFAYDYRHRLVRAEVPSGTVSLIYDEADRCIERRFQPFSGGPTEVSRFLHDGYRLHEVLDELGNVENRFIYGNGIDEIVAMERGGRRYFFHQQHLGSISHVTDETGVVVERYLYEDYGRRLILDPSGSVLSVSAIGNPLGWLGRWHDEDLELINFRTRWMDPVFGRFTVEDTAGMVDGPNLYTYALNNPVNFIDPLGEGTLADFGDGLKDGFLDHFAGGLIAGLKGAYDLIANAGEYWSKIRALQAQLSDPEVRSELWEELKTVLASALEEEWSLIESLLTAIRDGAARAIGTALGALLGYLLNKATTGIGGKIAKIFGKISERVTAFLRRRRTPRSRPRSTAWGGPGCGGPEPDPGPFTTPPGNPNYARDLERHEGRPLAPNEQAEHLTPKSIGELLDMPEVEVARILNDGNINQHWGGGIDKAVLKKLKKLIDQSNGQQIDYRDFEGDNSIIKVLTEIHRRGQRTPTGNPRRVRDSGPRADQDPGWRKVQRLLRRTASEAPPSVPGRGNTP